MTITPGRRRIAREVALTVGAVLGVLCVATAIAAPLLGVRLLVFKSGSMGPEINTGALAVTRTVDAGQVAVGDVVSVTTAEGTRVTHRVVRVVPDGDQVLLGLKGDANAQPDAETYPVTEVDRVVAHVNTLGYVVDALASPYAIFLTGAGAAGLLALTFGRRNSDQDGAETTPTTEMDAGDDTGPGSNAGDDKVTDAVTRTEADVLGPIGQTPAGPARAPVARRNGLRAAAIAVLVVPLLCTGTVAWGIFGGGAVAPTLASFSDTATVTAPASTLTVPTPAGAVECSNGGPFSGIVHLAWSAPDSAPAAYRYRIDVYTDDPASPVATYTATEPRVDVGRGDLGDSGTYQVRVTGELPDSTWQSADSIARTVWAGGIGWEINCS